MKILQVLNSISDQRGGTTTALRNLITALHREQLECDIITTSDDSLKHSMSDSVEAFAPECHTRILRFQKQMDFYSLSIPLLRWLLRNAHHYDLIHIHGLFNFVSGAAALAAAKAGTPYVVTPHGMLQTWCVNNRRPKLKKLSIAMMESKILRHAARVQFTTVLEHKEALQLGDFSASTIIPLGLDLSAMQIAGTERPAALPMDVMDRPTILFMSRIDPKKKLDTLLHAVSLLRQRMPSVLLLIAGAGEPALVSALKELSRRLGIEDNVLWLGFMSGPYKQWLLEHSSLAVLASHSENFGFAAVEAMANRTPVLLSPSVGLAPLVREYDAGPICAADAQQMADTVHTWLNDPPRLRQAGLAGQQLSRREFSIEVFGRRMTQLYADVVADARNAVTPARRTVRSIG